MADDRLVGKVQELSDLELAVLLCLISREHCIISSPPDAIDDLTEELKLLARNTFGLSLVVVTCTPSTTLEDFASALLIPRDPSSSSYTPYETRRKSGTDSYFVAKPALSRLQSAEATDTSSRTTAPRDIANFIIAKRLDRAPNAVQIQALELLRTRRIFTRTSVQTAPKQFVFVPLLEDTSASQARVNKHLNDFFFVSHWHTSADGFVNLEEQEAQREEIDNDATPSTTEKAWKAKDAVKATLITEADISHLAKLSQQVRVDVDVTRYQMNIVSHLRMHRAVHNGMTPAATRHLTQLIRCLAPLHGMDFVTPALVALATRKVYLHRICVTAPKDERSMQWGSQLEVVEAELEGIGPSEVIEDVLDMVTAPL